LRNAKTREIIMRRREFIRFFAGAAVMQSVAIRAQSAVPVIGYLGGGSPNKPYVAAFHQGLKEGGYVEGQNVAIESRFADGRYDQLPALATDLAGRGVTAIFAEGGSAPGRAAKQATKTIPIVFVNGDDPIRAGLVSSMNRPEGNVTGASLYTAALGPKKLELLRKLVPRAGAFGVLMNPGNPTSEFEADNVGKAAKAVGQAVHVIGVGSENDIDRAFETFNS
jgi:ABC-type uncharacterized transport system substrate-binding protein